MSYLKKKFLYIAKVTDDSIEDLIDEFCSDEEYFKEVEESSEIFKLTHICLPYESGKNEIEFQNCSSNNIKLCFKMLTSFV